MVDGHHVQVSIDPLSKNFFSGFRNTQVPSDFVVIIFIEGLLPVFNGERGFFTENKRRKVVQSVCCYCQSHGSGIMKMNQVHVVFSTQRDYFKNISGIKVKT